jgi:NAD+ diphosphatase
MIQDIAPKVFNNSFKNKSAELQDLFLSYEGDTVLVKEDKDKLWYPSFSDFEERYPDLKDNAQFLFNIDDINYYLVNEKNLAVDGWIYVNTSRFRTEVKYWRSFAGAVGWQLNRWYANHRFCSRCGKSTKPSDVWHQRQISPIAPCVKR